MPQAWPVTVTSIVIEDGYVQGLADNAVRQPTDSGRYMARRRGSAGGAPLTFQQNVTTAEMSDLTTFHDTTLKYGTLEFTRAHPGTGSDVTMMYMAPPSFSPAEPGRWIVTHQVWVLP
jgi:hypothetical protein